MVPQGHCCIWTYSVCICRLAEEYNKAAGLILNIFICFQLESHLKLHYFLSHIHYAYKAARQHRCQTSYYRFGNTECHHFVDLTHVSEYAEWMKMSAFCLLCNHQNLSHMVGRNPDNTVCAANVWCFGVLIYSSTLCGLLPSTGPVWSLSGTLVWWWTCRKISDPAYLLL